MSELEHLLTCLAEEGSEVTKDACKALRFGPQDRYANGPSNMERLAVELNQLIAVADLLAEAGVLPQPWINHRDQQVKRDKVQHWMQYAASVGALNKTAA